ncbi:MAG: hypothetical protein PVH41_13100 [Anaerolineae bacterium]|jgi:hypothetical protein
MTTARWEYCTVCITREGRKQKDWVARGQDGAGLVGFSTILEAYGTRGWELMSLNLERSSAAAGLGEWRIEPRAYRATFGRPVEASA